MKKSSNHETHQGYTLVETMVTLTIVGLLMYALLGFYQDSYRNLFTSEAKTLINRDIRNLTVEMTLEARNANHFVIYESFAQDMRDVPSDALPGEDGAYDASSFTSGILTDPDNVAPPIESIPQNFDATSFFRKRDGQSGDYLLLITLGDDLVPYDTPEGAKYPHDQDYTKPVIKLVGYYRSVENAAEQTGPVRKFTIYPQGANRYKPIEQLLPSPATASQHPVVVELSKGLANKRLFYNFRDRSIMVNGQIYHGNVAKWVTDTYNFTITPRG